MFIHNQGSGLQEMVDLDLIRQNGTLLCYACRTSQAPLRTQRSPLDDHEQCSKKDCDDNEDTLRLQDLHLLLQVCNQSTSLVAVREVLALKVNYTISQSVNKSSSLDAVDDVSALKVNNTILQLRVQGFDVATKLIDCQVVCLDLSYCMLRRDTAFELEMQSVQLMRIGVQSRNVALCNGLLVNDRLN